MAISTLFKVKAQTPIAHLSVLRKPLSTANTLLYSCPSLHNGSDTFIRYHEEKKANPTAEQVRTQKAEKAERRLRIEKKLLLKGWRTDNQEFWYDVGDSVTFFETKDQCRNDNDKLNDSGRPSDASNSKIIIPMFSAPDLFDLRLDMFKAKKETLTEMRQAKELERQAAEAQTLAQKAKVHKKALTFGLRDSLLQLRARMIRDDLVPNTQHGLRFTHSASCSTTNHTGPSEVKLIGPVAQYLTADKTGASTWKLIEDTMEKLKESEEYLLITQRNGVREVFANNPTGARVEMNISKLAQNRRYAYEDEEADFITDIYRELWERKRDQCSELGSFECEDSDGIE